MLKNKFANKFTQISNAVLNDNELTLEEKGLFCYLFSKPDGWEFHYNTMKKELNEKSDDTIRRILTSLVKKAETKNTDSVNTPYGVNADSVKLAPNNTNISNNTDNNNKDLIIIAKTQKKFVPPTIEEIKAYCNDKRISIDVERFYYYHDARGWMMGKYKMKNWKSAVRTWERFSSNKNSVANEFLELGRK